MLNNLLTFQVVSPLTATFSFFSASDMFLALCSKSLSKLAMRLWSLSRKCLSATTNLVVSFNLKTNQIVVTDEKESNKSKMIVVMKIWSAPDLPRHQSHT